MNRKNNSSVVSYGIGRLLLATVLTFAAAGVSTASVMIGQDLSLPLPDGVFSSGDGVANIESAESFVVSNALDVDNITWWGTYDPAPVADDFVVRVFADDGAGLPDNSGLIFEASNISPTRTSTGELDIVGGEIFAYSFNVPMADVFTLLSGDYWLSVVNQTTGSGADWYWAEGAAADGANALRDTSLQAAWTLDVNSFDLAFSLSGTAVSTGNVSIPPIWLLVILPAVLLVARRR